jgi:hypothetical protein
MLNRRIRKSKGVAMNARALRRVLLPLGTAVIVGASLYGLAGISSAASTPKLPRPAVVKTIRFVFSVQDKAGTLIQRETGAAKVIPVGVGPATSGQAGGAAPDLGVTGPSTVCLIHQLESTSVPIGDWGTMEFEFPSAPFVAGSEFNEQNHTAWTLPILYSSGNDVWLYERNEDNVPMVLDGYYAVLYWDGGC